MVAAPTAHGKSSAAVETMTNVDRPPRFCILIYETPSDVAGSVHELLELERMPDGMHDCVFQHRIDAVPRLPPRRVFRCLESFVVKILQRRAPPLQYVVRVSVGVDRERR